ncbi:hypothetical protein MMC12_003664 [Toensbergia leucococca]|nr:hypothetical protein [Toensbergia leucococca]
MHLSYSALVVAALSVRSAITLPGDKLRRIHYRHQRKHKRDIVDYSTISYTNINFDGVEFSTINYFSSSSPTPASAAMSIITIPTSVTVSFTASVSSTSLSTSDTSDDGDRGSAVEGGPEYSFPTQTVNSLGFGATTVPLPNDTTPIDYVGNLGNPLGSDIVLIKAADYTKYTYTNNVMNASSKQLTFII